ncbi:MAG: peptidylprolyl isomerase [Candidatus Bathyanammoxibius sp.]
MTVKSMIRYFACVTALLLAANPAPVAANPVPAAVQAGRDKVVAVINGKQIHNSEIERRMARYKGMDPSRLPDARNEILNEILVQTVIAEYLEKQGLQPVEQEVDDAVKNIRENMEKDPKASGKTLEDILTSYGTSLEQMKGELRNTIGLRKHIGQKVNYDVLIEYFNENKDAFSGAEVRVSHILIDTRKTKTKKEYAIAYDKIHKLKKELDGGADFAELAKANSACPSASKGGDLDFFHRKGPGAPVEPFAKKAFSMKVGDICEPIQTEFGFHIIKVTDRKAGKEVKFEDVKDQVETNYIDGQIQELITKLMTEAKIEIKGLS